MSTTSPGPSAVPVIDFSQRSVAYFSMEIALSKDLPTYSGGLGMLAGDTLRSAADMAAPIVAVSLAHRKGYFQQHLDLDGQQTETDVVWDPASLPAAGPQIVVNMQGRDVRVQAWRFDVVGVTGHIVPVYLLDTDIEGNLAYDRSLTDKLYGGDTYYRLCQEAVLGLGGIAMLHALGMAPEVCHMNEGHAALLTVGLLQQRVGDKPLSAATLDDASAVQQRCVFTTHTPVPAGHDHFTLDQMHIVLGPERSAAIERFGALHNGLLNMTYLALRFSRYVNGVAMQHGKVSQQMFPEYHVHSITNGVHAGTWVAPPMAKLLDREVPEWRHDNQYFRNVFGIDPQAVHDAHAEAQKTLCKEVTSRTGISLDPQFLTIGFARRVATYKRAHLLFRDPERLVAIANKLGGLQILYAGKAHPADVEGKGLIREVFAAAKRIACPNLKIIYLENYDWGMAESLVAGVDVWLNTPQRPYEASGTSGMKAALNGVPSLSVLDGWWIEGCAEGVTGWAIDDCDDEDSEAKLLYEKLENAVAPMFADKKAWMRMQQHCIAINGTFFNTDRMLGQYVSNAYFPAAASVAITSQHETPELEPALA